MMTTPNGPRAWDIDARNGARHRRDRSTSCACCRTAIPFLLVDQYHRDGQGRELHRHQERDRQRAALSRVTSLDKPIMPGVLIIEAMAQTAGALCLWNGGVATGVPQAVYFMTIDKAKFRRSPSCRATGSSSTCARCATGARCGGSAGQAKVDGDRRRRGRSGRDARRPLRGLSWPPFILPPSSRTAHSSATASTIGPFCCVGDPRSVLGEQARRLGSVMSWWSGDTRARGSRASHLPLRLPSACAPQDLKYRRRGDARCASARARPSART